MKGLSIVHRDESYRRIIIDPFNPKYIRLIITFKEFEENILTCLLV